MAKRFLGKEAGSAVIARSYPASVSGYGPISNTTADTQMFALTLPLLRLAALDVVKFDVNWDIANASGSTQSVLYKWFLNGTQIGNQTINYATASNQNTRNRHILDIDMILASLLDQRWSFTISGTASSGASATIDSATANRAAGGSFATSIDMSAADPVFSMTAAPSVASTSLDVRLFAAAATRFR